MRAVVLVGGFGTRLRPLTNTIPKPLLPVGHVPIVEHVIANLARGGVTEAVLALGFKPDDFTAAYPDGTCAGVRLHYAIESEPLDTAGAIAFAARHLGIDETFVVANGDVLTDLDVTELVAFHRRQRAEGSLHLMPVEDPSVFGVVATDDNGRVTAFVEKPPPGEAPSNLINAGTYVLEPSVLDRVEAGRKISIERVTFPAMVAAGSLYAMGREVYWLDVGRPEPYCQANLDVLDGKRRHVRADAIGEGAVVDRAARVEHSMIGAGTIIAAGAVVRDSVVLDHAAIAADAHVEGCVLGPGTRVGKGARLVRVVTGEAVEVEASTHLIDARVPEPSVT